MTSSIDIRARKIIQEVEDEITGLAYDLTHMYFENPDLVEEGIYNKIKELITSKTKDISGSLADQLYNEVDTLVDLLGVRISDYSSDKNNQVELINALSKSAHFPALRAAVHKIKEA